MSNDSVHHPSHYTNGSIECIDAMRSMLGNHFEGYCSGQVLKYLWRYPHKNGVQDLEKALVYLQWLIKFIKEKKQ